MDHLQAHVWAHRRVWEHRRAHMQVWEHIQALIWVLEHIQAHNWVWGHLQAHIRTLLCAFFAPGAYLGPWDRTEDPVNDSTRARGYTIKSRGWQYMVHIMAVPWPADGSSRARGWQYKVHGLAVLGPEAVPVKRPGRDIHIQWLSAG